MKNIISQFSRPSLRIRIFIIFSTVVTVFSIFLYYYLSKQFQERILSTELSKTISVTNLTAVSISIPFHQNDTVGIEEIFSSLRREYDIAYIVLLNNHHTIVSEFNSDAAAKYRYLDQAGNNVVDIDHGVIRMSGSVRFAEDEIGTIYLGFSLRTMIADLNIQQQQLAWISIVRLLFGVLLVFILTTIVLRPINTMMNRFISNVKFDIFAQMQTTGYEEIDRFVRSFNTMVIDLQSTQEELHSVNKTLEQRVNARTFDLQIEVQHHKDTGIALRESEERYRTLVELSPDAIIVYVEKKFHFINSAVLSVFNVESFEILREKSLHDFLDVHHVESFKEMLHQVIQGKTVTVHTEYQFRRGDAGDFIGEVTATKLVFQGHDAVQIVIRDISDRITNERKRLELEQQLLHVQKKEIIGTLSSGIAHDILNILSIIGTAINKLLFLKNIDEQSLKETAEQISKATERGKALVKQLLTFAKKTELNFDSTMVNAPVMEIVNIVQRTFPGTIAIESRLNENLPLIRADNNQLHQALLNLCLNARDAIRGHGKIIIETTMKSAMRLNGELGKHGEYICIAVYDDGIGMTPEVLQRIYEPFFTTKDDGTGSGLGLAMVKGIVENHRGFIDVESEPGKGTTFRIYLPV